MTEPVTSAQIERLTTELEKLSRHVVVLQRDVRTLAGRIIPYEDEDLGFMRSLAWDDYAIKLLGPKMTMPDLIGVVVQADRQLRNAEMDVGFIKSRIDDVANSTDWKAWVRDQSEVRERGGD